MPEYSVPPAVRAFMAGIVDYAGLFPPAALPLDEAIRNYAAYRQHPDAWMLGRFVIPASRLRELHPYTDLFQQSPPFRFSVLGSPAHEPESALTGVDITLNQINAFRRAFPGLVLADMLELRVPEGLFSFDEAVFQRYFVDVRDRVEAAALPAMEMFFEMPLSAGTSQALRTAILGLQAYNKVFSSDSPFKVGLKIRTGGVTPDAFPSIDAVSEAIRLCQEHGVRFKATAGLHHPVRHFHDSVQTEMHGFLNLFGGAILLHAGALSQNALPTLMADQDGNRFTLGSNTLKWHDAKAASVDAILQARQQFAASFGSCSFDEPREDLREMGIAI